MSNWYPGEGRFIEYLQKKSLMKDTHNTIISVGKLVVNANEENTRHLTTKISEQTLTMIANAEQLYKEFGRGFDGLNNTLEWGFGSVVDSLGSLETTIDSLHADFNYGMGLLIKQMSWNGEKISDLVKEVDKIRGILQSPNLTKAREFYRRGNDCFVRGLLVDAIELLKEAEKIDRTDFFTQFLLGTIYLYGVNKKETVIDLGNAKHHLLLAAKYSEAEISFKGEFANYAAESLFHASIAVYATLGETGIQGDEGITRSLLVEARGLAKEAVKIHPTGKFLEAQYHIAKYSALLGEPEEAISTLKKVIRVNKDFAVKVDIDHAFDPVRELVSNLLTNFYKSAKNDSSQLIEVLEAIINIFQLMDFEKSDSLKNVLVEFKVDLTVARTCIQKGTFFGYMDAIEIVEDPLKKCYGHIIDRFEEIRKLTNNLIIQAKESKPYGITYPNDGGKGLREIDDSLRRAMALMEKHNPYPETYSYIINAFERAGLFRFLPRNSKISQPVLTELVESRNSEVDKGRRLYELTKVANSVRININLLRESLEFVFKEGYLPHKQAFELSILAKKNAVQTSQIANQNRDRVNQIRVKIKLAKADVSTQSEYRKSSKLFAESKAMIDEAEKLLQKDSYEALIKALSLVEEAGKITKKALRLLEEEKDISSMSVELMQFGSTALGLIGASALGLQGCKAVVEHSKGLYVPNFNYFWNSGYNAITGILVGGIGGALLGATLGAVGAKLFGAVKYRGDGIRKKKTRGSLVSDAIIGGMIPGAYFGMNTLAVIGAFSIGIMGCESCQEFTANRLASFTEVFWGDGFNLFTGFLYGGLGGGIAGAVLGAIGGAVFGAIIDRVKK